MGESGGLPYILWWRWKNRTNCLAAHRVSFNRNDPPQPTPIHTHTHICFWGIFISQLWPKVEWFMIYSMQRVKRCQRPELCDFSVCQSVRLLNYFLMCLLKNTTAASTTAETTRSTIGGTICGRCPESSRSGGDFSGEFGAGINMEPI